MEHIRILLLGVSFRVYISYKIPRPHGLLGLTKVIKSPGPMEHIRILVLGVSFRVYIRYEVPRPHGAYTHTSVIRFFFRVYISCKIRTRQKNGKD